MLLLIYHGKDMNNFHLHYVTSNEAIKTTFTLMPEY